jgi:hypothetical protein
LRVNDLTIRIEGATWRDANDAAHLIAHILTTTVELRRTRQRLLNLGRRVDDALKAVDALSYACSVLSEAAHEVDQEQP